jgi:hypothetical protein
MIVCCKLPNGLNIGGFIIRGAMIGHEDHQLVSAPGRERIASYEITRNVPDDLWQKWYRDNINSPIIQRKLIAGFVDGDDQSLNQFCWENTRITGWMKATQGASSL